MFDYAITFRIADVVANGQTYAQRRAKLVENARSADLGYWEETTSFFFVESPLDTYALGKKICEGLSAQHDMVVVFDPQDMSACYFGAVKREEVLLSFLPKAKKLP